METLEWRYLLTPWCKYPISQLPEPTPGTLGRLKLLEVEEHFNMVKIWRRCTAKNPPPNEEDHPGVLSGLSSPKPSSVFSQKTSPIPNKKQCTITPNNQTFLKLPLNLFTPEDPLPNAPIEFPKYHIKNIVMLAHNRRRSIQGSPELIQTFKQCT